MALRIASGAVAAVVSLGLVSVGSAAISEFSAGLSGDNEVPANDSEATGTFLGIYDSDANSFAFEWDITGPLSGTPTVSHIHQAPVGVNGPVVFGFNSPGPTWPLAGSATWNGLSPAQVDTLFNGGFYVNFHTTVFPGGELRGQITLIPSAGAGALLACAGIVGVGRRRRRG
ncbi:MAG: CHRD domain-containing protein [Phycisphaerales bacterium]